MFCQYKSYSASTSDILPIGVNSAIMFCRNYLQFNCQFCSVLPFCSALSIQYTQNGEGGKVKEEQRRGGWEWNERVADGKGGKWKTEVRYENKGKERGGDRK